MQLAPSGGVSAPLAFSGLRACSPGAVLALNNAHEAETSFLDADRYDRLLAASGFAVAAAQTRDPMSEKAPEEALGAFLIAFNEASVHDNENLAWFRANHDRFYYVDRIIVAVRARGQGLARALYHELFDQARGENRLSIGCEINVSPANHASDALHEALGFTEIGRPTVGDGKIIRYMRLKLE